MRKGPRCIANVLNRYHYDRCTRLGSLEYEGKMYCKQHHPPTVEAAHKARAAKWEAQRQAELQHARHTRAAQKEMERKAAAYDRLQTWLREFEAATARIGQVDAIQMTATGYRESIAREIRTVLEGE